MDTRFILPAAVATAFHTFVLFGLTWEHPPKTVEVITRTFNLVPPPQSELELASESPANNDPNQGAAKGEPRVAPHIDEPPPMDGIGVQIEYQPVKPGPVDPGALTPGVFGDPLGHEGGSGPGNIASVINLDNHPRATAQVSPIYPGELKSRGIEGTVVVEFIVDETGHVTSPHVVRSSNSGFDEPTLRAVANWRFEPGRKNNKTVRYRMALPVDFKLGSE